MHETEIHCTILINAGCFIRSLSLKLTLMLHSYALFFMRICRCVRVISIKNVLRVNATSNTYVSFHVKIKQNVPRGWHILKKKQQHTLIFFLIFKN